MGLYANISAAIYKATTPIERVRPRYGVIFILDKENLFTEKKPLRDEIIGMMNKRPRLKERKTVAERVTEKILGYIETFINGITRP